MAIQRAAREVGCEAAPVRSEGALNFLSVRTRTPGAIGLEADPSLTGPNTFNPHPIVNDLRRAIDQSDVEIAGVEPSDGLMGSVKFKWHRKVNFDAVYKALDNLSSTQIATVRRLYLAQEKTTLDNDLFDNGQSGYPSSLSVNQRARLQVLLRGTKGDALEPETPEWLRRFKPEIAARLQSTLTDAKLPADRLNQLERAALEIVDILSDDLNDAKREHLMALHRRPVNEISVIDVFYERHTGVNLPTELGGKLEGLQLSRMYQLRTGNIALADAFAIEDRRRAIERIDAERRKVGALSLLEPAWIEAARVRRRQANVDQIDEIIGLNRQEAIAEAKETSTSASQAVADRLRDVLSQGRNEEGKNVGDLLTVTLGVKKGAELTATANGALIEAYARKLAETESRKATKADQLATTLRELRELAKMDLIARAADPWLSLADKQKLLANHDQAVNDLAMSYVATFRETYEQVRGEGRPYAEIVSDFSGVDEDMVTRLAAGGGAMKDEEELDLAIRRDKPDLVIAILKRQPSKEFVDLLAVKYFALTGKSLQRSLFGSRYYNEVVTAEEAASPDRKSLGNMIAGGIASGRDAALVGEQLEKPAAKDRGGIIEMKWVAASAEREFKATWDNRGVTGRLREIGDDPETETIMRQSIAQIRTLRSQWITSTDKDERRRILAEMKRWRATLTGDAAAYEADNKKMLDNIRSAVSIAVQLALAIALPGAGATFMSFVRVTAMNIATSVASNVVIYGEDYNLDQLRGDIVGGVLGAAGGKLGEEFVGAALAAKEARAVADEIAERITKPVADATASAAAKVGIGTTIAAEAASQLGSTAGQSLAMGENQFTFDNLFQGAWMSGAGRFGRKVLGLDTPTPPATAPVGGEPVPSAAEPAPPATVPTAPAAETALPAAEPAAVAKPPVSEPAATAANAPAPKPREVNKHVVRRPAAVAKAQPDQQPAGVPTPPVAETVQQTKKPVPEADAPVGPKAPGGDAAQEHTQVTGTPTGTVVQAADPYDLPQAWKLYRQHIAADPTREVALLYNHDLDQWAVVQGGPGSVPTLDGMRRLGWEVHDTTLARHSHPVGRGGVTSKANLLPSGRGGDLQIVRGDAPRGHPSAAPYVSAIDVMIDRGFGPQPDRTFLFYDRRTDMWIVDYPAAGERGGRARVSFVSLDQYRNWFQGEFLFSPDIPADATGPAGPHSPETGGPLRFETEAQERSRVRERLDEHLNHMIENDIGPQSHLGYNEGKWEQFKRNYENDPERALADLEGRLIRYRAWAEKTRSPTEVTEEYGPNGPELSVSSETSLARAAEAGIPSELLGEGTVMTRADFPGVVPDAPPATGRPAPEQLQPVRQLDPAGSGFAVEGRPVSRSEIQNVDMLHDYDLLIRAGADPASIRVNQWQVIGDMAVGTNRPDLYAELPNGQRIHIEYDRAPGTRSMDHAQRILTNDPHAIVILKIIDFD